ncbi:hypothetical protein l13_10630 [Neisseria weaveri ATCC 51223]|nr:hypothetical protein l13_10630 [Neisseria weaveri ATCC 51223]
MDKLQSKGRLKISDGLKKQAQLTSCCINCHPAEYHYRIVHDVWLYG